MLRSKEYIDTLKVTTNTERRLRLLFYLLTTYILLQFAWWAYLLIDLNTQLYAPLGGDKVRIKVLMVLGEGSVFLLFLLIGVYIMQRTIRKDIALVRQQRNFLLSITHELKTPVAAIKLCLQTLRKRSHLAEAQRQPLEQSAIDNTERLHKLIDNVLLATRIESGQTLLQKEQVNLSTLTHRICEGLQQTLAAGALIEIDVKDGVHALVDEGAYESILVNLVENAVKYAQGGKITIGLTKKRDQALLQVADEGTGIPPAERQRVFQKFYRMGNEETRTKKGTGLGLYIVASLAQLLGARVSISDNSPQGAIFTISFPSKLD